jgi:hypothetical protein
VRIDLFGRSFVGGMAVVDDIDARRQRERRDQILLDQHDGLSGPRQFTAGLRQILGDDRREPFERLVTHDDRPIAH